MLLTAMLHKSHTKEQLLAHNSYLPNDNTHLLKKFLKL